MVYKLLIILGFVFISPAFCQKKIDREHFVSLLQSGAYGRVFDECVSMRNGIYGKCAILDYFIAKSLCLDGYQQKSNEWLKYILDNYPLKDATRQFISNDIANCTRINAVSSLGTILTIPLPQASVSGVTKMGPVYNCLDKSQLIEWKNLATEEELESRLFPLSEKEKALKKIQVVVGTGYKVNIGNQFIIVTKITESITDREVNNVINELQKGFDFYKNFYSLRAPDKFITVYLMPNQESLHNVALKIHGIDVGKATLGYSLLGDLSLLGIAAPNHIGTLYHELFHLMIRTDAGDIPAWLDEGLASLYSVYDWKSDTLRGSETTWRLQQIRDEYLRKSGLTLPTLSQLINFNWREFNGGDNINLCKASINYALSNHVMIFLQQKALLQPLVSHFKSRNTPGSKNDSSAESNISIAEKVCGLSIDSLQKEFENWFEHNYQFNLYQKKTIEQYEIGEEYMTMYSIEPKIQSMLSYIESQNPKENNEIFVDSTRKILHEIEYKHNSVNSLPRAEQYDKLKELNDELFVLYNQATAISQRLKSISKIKK